MSREAYEKGSMEKLASGFWIVFIFILVFWLISYCIFPPVSYWTHVVFGLIMEDWGIAVAFFSLLFITIGWSIIEGIMMLIFYFKLKYNDSFRNLIKAFKFIIYSYFLLMIAFRYITIWDFDEPLLYISALVFLVLISIIYFKSKLFKMEFKLRKTIATEDFRYIYIPIERIVYAASLAGFVFILMYLHFVVQVEWIIEFFNVFILQLIHNPIIATFFILTIICLFFLPLIQILFDLLPKFSIFILSNKSKKKIKALRIWTLLFLAVTILIKIIPFWELPEYAENLISIFSIIFVWLIKRKMYSA